MKIKARDYQEECLVKIAQTVEQGEKRALVVMASGLGKTYTAAFAVEKFFADRPFGRVPILCHSEPILRQTKNKFKSYFGDEYNYGLYTSNEKATRQTDFLFATFQTMKENRKEFSKGEFAYIIIDEAHHSQARTYFPTIHYFQPEFLLGLTATPDRLDGQKIEEIYGEPVYELGFAEATSRGLLTECDYRLVLDDLSQEKIDEYLQSSEKVSINQLNRTLFVPKRDEEIVRLIGEYSADVENPKTMIFCRTIEHARKIAKLMQSEAVALIHKKQSDSMNRRALQAFRDGEIRTIISVQMLNEGVDVPDANVIVFLRNTVSSAVFYQQLGRGTRLAPGKDKTLILDFVGNCERIRTVFELKQEIDDFRIGTPVTEYNPHGAGNAEAKEKFTLNIATPEFKTQMVNIVEILRRIRSRTAWSKETAINALQELATSLGKTRLMARDIRLASEEDCTKVPSREVLKTLFGSIKNAVIAAGLEYGRGFTGTERGNFDCEEDLFKAARAYAARLGHPTYLTIAEIDANLDFPCWETLRKTYHSLGNFLELAGLERMKRDHMKYKTKQAVREALQRKISSLGGKSPTRRQLGQDENMPTIDNILKFYPSYNAAIIDAGGKVNARKGMKDAYPDKVMAEQALQMQKDLGRAPSMAEWDQNPNTCPANVLEKRHGSYNNAMIAYGVTPNPRYSAIKPHNKHTKFLTEEGGLTDDTKKKLQSIVQLNKRKIKSSDLCSENGLPYSSYFHSNGWTLSRLNSEIEAERIISEIISPNYNLSENVIRDLQSYVRKVRRPLLSEDFKIKHDGIVGISYLRKHGITSIETINCLVGSDAILSQLDVATN